MYSISSSEALAQFMTNPRVYLKPPNPKIPCKVCVLGPPTSGKSTLAKAIAFKYNAMVNTCTIFSK
jgi:adenylate/nucleoside-diphosphate kinase